MRDNYFFSGRSLPLIDINIAPAFSVANSYKYSGPGVALFLFWTGISSEGAAGSHGSVSITFGEKNGEVKVWNISAVHSFSGLHADRLRRR